MSRNESAPDVAYRQLNLVVSFDDTNTRAAIIVREPVVGDVVVAEGKAKRRKGDDRNREAGLGLAVSRALRSLADTEFAHAERLLEGQ